MRQEIYKEGGGVKERRRFKRLNVKLPVTLRYQGRLIPATALNISCGGICLFVKESKVTSSHNKKVEVVMDLSQKERDVSIRGEVIRMETGNQSKISIKFTNLYTVGHQTLENYINRNLN